MCIRDSPEAHLRRLRRHAKLAQQAFEPSVVAVVEDDEARIEIVGSGVCLDMHRVGVPSRPVARLEYDQLVIAVQQVRAYEPGDSRTDDRDPHARSAANGSTVIYIALFCLSGRDVQG